ncbi:MAG: NAD(P)-dependent glycerol-3-phosphate dehydrogenase [Proteobacteria bacterium]|nr:NAD(P)-dependent glycerol-3-phosphate dehydrogenase [Pseudomonadota bacterium]MBU1714161.1 NAD(P)-dependent glycerol-3-phosphate dehydrogenase [Pseudomonadota bacterium]
MSLSQVAVIGAGSWGTALAKLLSDNGKQVILWGHCAKHIDNISKLSENTTYLPGCKLSKNIKFTNVLSDAVDEAQAIVMVVPSHVFRDVFSRIVPFLKKNQYIISATKGIENESLMTMTQVMAEIVNKSTDLPFILSDLHLGVLAGPSFAKEVANGTPTAVTVAAKVKSESVYFQKLFFSANFRVYASTDVIGQELGGALKNIVAIAAGICDGLGYGTNTRAALITRGLAEITRLGVKMGASPHTFSGLAGMGDLVLTCTGDLSRNRTVGLKLGQGLKINDIVDHMDMVAEGVKTTWSAKKLADRFGVEMPILDQVYQVIYEDKPCNMAVISLLNRDQKDEIDF